MILIRGLTHLYPGSRKRPAHQALGPLDLEIADGEFFVLTGPNGGGKSTLFRILSGLLLPSAGSVQVAGSDLLRQPHATRRQMGVVFQKPALDKYLTVLENLRIHADLYDLSPALFRHRLEEVLHWTGLRDRLSTLVDHLSGGLQRQVELAKALLHEPKLLLMDEPTTGLDPNLRHAFLKTLERIRKERPLTILMTSHLFSEAERADSVAILKGGKLLARDRPARLKARLGREMLVAASDDLTALELTLARWPEVTVTRLEGELRIEGGDPMVMMEALLAEHRASLRHLAIKQPELEDVYIHLTGRSLQEDEENKA